MTLDTTPATTTGTRPNITTSSTTGTPGEVSIRRAVPSDAAAVRTLLLELADHENSTDAVQATEADWRAMLANPSVLVLLALVDGEPGGYVSGVRQLNLWIGRDILAMDDLYVRAAVRDRGIGGRLMAALAEHVSADRMLVTWGVRQDNDAGHRFYRRLGATLRTKMVAAWQPRAYDAYVRAAHPRGRL